MRTLPSRGFTFLEILFSLVVFSAGMLAYMNYQGRASAMLFDTESSSLATAIAVEASEELSSLTEDDYRALMTNLGLLAADSAATDWMSDIDFKTKSSLLQYTPGPFDEYGRPLAGGNLVFYRMMRAYTYRDLTQTNFEENSPREVLRVVEILVQWPNKDSLTTLECDTPNPACNEIRTHVIKPIFYY